jgi:CHAD domain-containing protein
MSIKWIENCDRAELVDPFASRVLQERMESVEGYLLLAAENHAEDPEHVHQLRVSCRRAMAALRSFTPLMRNKPRKLKKWLQQIREAAGPARDLDVLVHRFRQGEQDEVAAYAIERLEAERAAAQSQVAKIAKKALPKKFKNCVDVALVLKLREPYPTVGEYGLKAVNAAYEPFAQLANCDNPTSNDLHQLRIAGKRLRYALEIFHGIFPADMREEIYPLIEELQERLGTINDHATAQALFQSWLGEMPVDGLSAAVAKRVAKEHKSLLRHREKFLEWWSTERRERIEDYFQLQLGPRI